MRKNINQLQSESDYWHIKFINEQKRAETPEAKLAELEKQEPAGTVWIDCTTRGTEYEFRPSGKIINGQELFTRPAPVINLAEMVPVNAPIEVVENMDEVLDVHVPDSDMQSLWSVCRAAILRKIEEKIK